MSKRTASTREKEARQGESKNDLELNVEDITLDDEEEEEEEEWSEGNEEDLEWEESDEEKDEEEKVEEEENQIKPQEGEEDNEKIKSEDEGSDHESEEDTVYDNDLITHTWDDAEYTDTSDEEELRNTVGNIPLEWYDDYPHIGYDLDGKKILKPLQRDQLDEFLKKMDDPNYWRTVVDKVTGKEIILTDEDIDLIEKIQRSQFPEPSFDPNAPYLDIYSHEKMIHPVINRPEPKRRFLPSLWERKKITKLVKLIKAGKIKPLEKPKKPKFYMIWGDSQQEVNAIWCPGSLIIALPGYQISLTYCTKWWNDEQLKNEKLRPHQFIPAPRLRLPGHAESYNPPPEYIPIHYEKKWEESKPDNRRYSFVPTKYSSLRLVPAYPSFIKERFERCLDLYLCPRQTRMRIKVEPDALIPQIPKPRDLQPFPTNEYIVYKGHTGLVRCIAVDNEGAWLASASDDLTLRLWEVSTGRCLKTIVLPGKPMSLSMCPNDNTSLLAVAVEQLVILINHGLGDRLVVMATDSALSSVGEGESHDDNYIEWRDYTTDEYHSGFRLYLEHKKTVQQVIWHHKGDYFASVTGGGGTSAVYIHQLSKRRSQNPFKSPKGLVQKVIFHPSRPFFFVATQTYVRVYNLTKQELTKKLTSGVKWISSIDIHPKGDNIIIGSYDKRLCWFDMDLSTKPYKILRHHRQAIRQVCYHPTYPLFASGSDDGSVIICHGMVYNDLMQNPLIVPVKVLRGHSSVDTLGVTDCVFHPNQPWIFSAGADCLVKLYS